MFQSRLYEIQRMASKLIHNKFAHRKRFLSRTFSCILDARVSLEAGTSYETVANFNGLCLLGLLFGVMGSRFGRGIRAVREVANFLHDGTGMKAVEIFHGFLSQDRLDGAL